jgi:hypothetical protein
VWERDKGRSLPGLDPKDWYELPAKLLAFGYAISSEHITAGAAIGFDQAGTLPCW